jgi:cholesterol transport system auxiliary component
MRAWAAAAGLLAAGCVSVLPDVGPAPQIYRLDGSSAGGVRAASLEAVEQSDVTVMVAEPMAPRALSTDRIAVVMGGGTLSYAAGSRWNERAPRVIQERILRAFEDDGRIAAAVRPEDAVQSRYEVRLDLLRFEAVYRDGDAAAPTVVAELRGKLIDRQSRDLVASMRFEAERRASDNRMGAIVVAFEMAMDDVGRTVVDWTLAADAASPSGEGGRPQRSDRAASSSR